MLGIIYDNEKDKWKTANIFMLLALFAEITCLIYRQYILSLLPTGILILIIKYLGREKVIDLFLLHKKTEISHNQIPIKKFYAVFAFGRLHGYASHVKNVGRKGYEILIKDSILFVLKSNCKKNDKDSVIVLNIDEIKMTSNNYFVCLNHSCQSEEENKTIEAQARWDKIITVQDYILDFLIQLETVRFIQGDNNVKELIKDEPGIVDRTLTQMVDKRVKQN